MLFKQLFLNTDFGNTDFRKILKYRIQWRSSSANWVVPCG